MQIPLSKKDSFKIFDDIAIKYDSINTILSFGTHHIWRKKVRKNLPDMDSIKVLDLATGTGDVAFELLKHDKVNHVTGLDLSQEMLKVAVQKAKNKKVSDKVTFLNGNACQLPFAENSFEAATMAFGIRNVPDVNKCLSEIHRILKPGGKVLILEFSIPKNPVVRFLHLGYLRKILPFIGNLLSGHKFAYSYLNKTIETFPYRSDFVKKMNESGFKQAGYIDFTFGIVNLYWGLKG